MFVERYPPFTPSIPIPRRESIPAGLPSPYPRIGTRTSVRNLSVLGEGHSPWGAQLLPQDLLDFRITESVTQIGRASHSAGRELRREARIPA
jgi:hypothetical protein